LNTPGNQENGKVHFNTLAQYKAQACYLVSLVTYQLSISTIVDCQIPKRRQRPDESRSLLQIGPGNVLYEYYEVDFPHSHQVVQQLRTELHLGIKLDEKDYHGKAIVKLVVEELFSSARSDVVVSQFFYPGMPNSCGFLGVAARL
jgi:hypothetical protein